MEYPSKLVRIRDNATVKELNIPSDRLKIVEKVLKSNVADPVKRGTIKALTEGSPCCVCGGIPSLEIHYPVIDGGATRIERYCEPCANKVYQREQVL